MSFNGKVRSIDNMKFLIYAETEADAWIITSVLNSYGIMTHMDPATYGGSLNVLFGPNVSGINIYVMECDYAEAEEILESEIEGLPDEN